MYGNTIYDATITSSVTVCFDAIRRVRELESEMLLG
jgi:hypothetical protein